MSASEPLPLLKQHFNYFLENLKQCILIITISFYSPHPLQIYPSLPYTLLTSCPLIFFLNLDVMVQDFYPSIYGTGQTNLCEFQVNQGYIVRPCLKSY